MEVMEEQPILRLNVLQKRILWSSKNLMRVRALKTLQGRDMTLSYIVTWQPAKQNIKLRKNMYPYCFLLFRCVWPIQTYVNMIRIRSPTLCHSLTEQNNMNSEASSPIASAVSMCHYIVNKRISDSQELVGIWPLLNSLPFSPCRNILHRSCPRCPGTCGRFWPLRCAELSPLSPPPE